MRPRLPRGRTAISASSKRQSAKAEWLQRASQLSEKKAGAKKSRACWLARPSLMKRAPPRPGSWQAGDDGAGAVPSTEARARRNGRRRVPHEQRHALTMVAGRTFQGSGHLLRREPVIRSLLDTDFYKLLMLQMIWRFKPSTHV